ncbi:hypothetical protein TNCV_3667371 [Trichonephila clavipes]|nr:hypothetical protein TNCV_3667371 [Trichonephila clavipes]
MKINPQEKNTVSDTSTNKDTLSKEKESENENDETKLIRKDFAHYVGTPIDADLREQILKWGPYQLEGNFQKDAKGRSFSSSYSFISKAGQKIEWKWLCYSMRLHVAYCQTEIILENNGTPRSRSQDQDFLIEKIRDKQQRPNALKPSFRFFSATYRFRRDAPHGGLSAVTDTLHPRRGR